MSIPKSTYAILLLWWLVLLFYLVACHTLIEFADPGLDKIL